jgi:hypothetical protein
MIIPAGRITEIGLKVAAYPREGLTKKDLTKIIEDLGNDIVDDTLGSLILIEKVYPISYEPAEDFDAYEALWKCDYCQAHSRDRDTIVKHEKDVHNA